MKRKLHIILLMFFILLATNFSDGGIKSSLLSALPIIPSSAVKSETQKQMLLFVHDLATGETLQSILASNGFDTKQAHRIILAVAPLINLKQLKSRTRISFYSDSILNCCSSRHIKKIVVAPKEGTTIEVTATQESLELTEELPKVIWTARQVEAPVETRLVSFAANISHGNLWRSSRAAGIDLGAMSVFTDVLGWELDFEYELQDTGSLSFIIEEVLSNGRHLKWSKIQAAEIYTGKRFVQAVHFGGDEKTPPGYYRPDGQSLERLFLKSPIEGSRITSGFSFVRFHPIFKSNRPHLGIDYAAPIGTPIRSIGAGIVEEADFHNGSGKFLRIRHNSVYETAYKHLSQFAENLKPGARVERGDVIGFVGATGWATGPHLHFEVYRNGEYVNPSNESFPSSHPLDTDSFRRFKKSSNFWLAQLPKKSGSTFLVKK
jgi:murein DD-endopeptidase MepM/ murein hydrolase activator NlpD